MSGIAIFIEIDFFILHATPETFNKNIVQSTSLAIQDSKFILPNCLDFRGHYTYWMPHRNGRCPSRIGARRCLSSIFILEAA